MPYARRKGTKRPKRSVRRRTGINRRVKRYVKGMVRKSAIMRRAHTTGTEVSVPVLTKLGASNILSMFEITQGTGASQRLGAAARATGINAKFIFFNNRTDTVMCRLSCIIFNEGGVVVNSVSELFETSTGDETTITNSLISMIAPYQKDTVRVLYDRTFTLSAYATEKQDTKYIRTFIRMNRKLKYSANNSTVTNGRICWLMFCNDTGNDAVTGDLEVTYQIDQYFTEEGKNV